LRPLQASDADAWLAGLNDFDVTKWLAAVPFPFTPADFAGCLAAAEPGRHWAIVDAAGACGGIGLAPHLGYWLAPRAQCRGYGGEAAGAVLAAHFANPAAGAVTSGYFEGNTGSARLLTKLGFAETRRGPEHCRARGADLPHVSMALSRAAWAAANPFTLTTPRLLLDPLTEADAPAIRRIVTHPAVGPMLFVFAPDLSAQAALDMVRGWRWTGTPPFRLALRLGRALVGTIGLKSLDDPEIYYFLAPELHGHGLLSEALPVFLAAVSERFALPRLTARVFTDNPASARLLIRNGFRPGATSAQATPARTAPAPVSSYTRP